MCTGHLWAHLQLHFCNINIAAVTSFSVSLKTADPFKLLTPQREAGARKMFAYCFQGSLDTQYLGREREIKEINQVPEMGRGKQGRNG